MNLENNQLSFPTPQSDKKKHLQKLLDTYHDTLSVGALDLFRLFAYHQELFGNLEKLITSNTPELREKTAQLSQHLEELLRDLDNPAKIQAALKELGIGVTNLAQHFLYELPAPNVSKSSD